RGGLLRRRVVADEERRRAAAQRDVALLARRQLGAVRVDDRDLVPGRGEPHRAGAELHSGEVADEKRVLGLPVAVADRLPERLLEGPDHLRVERLAGGDEMADAREV